MRVRGRLNDMRVRVRVRVNPWYIYCGVSFCNFSLSVSGSVSGWVLLKPALNPNPLRV